MATSGQPAARPRGLSRDLAEGVRAPGGPRRDDGAEVGADARYGRAPAGRVPIRARPAPALPRQLGQGLRSPATRAVDVVRRASARSSTCRRPTACTSTRRRGQRAHDRLQGPDRDRRLEPAGAARPRRAAGRARPRARAHPVRPRAVHDRARHPPARRQRPSGHRRHPAARGASGAARMVPRGGAQR